MLEEWVIGSPKGDIMHFITIKACSISRTSTRLNLYELSIEAQRYSAAFRMELFVVFVGQQYVAKNTKDTPNALQKYEGFTIYQMKNYQPLVYGLIGAFS